MKLFSIFNFKKQRKVEYTAAHVGDFYNTNHDAFIKVYGEVIQAFRTNNLATILQYQAEQIGIKSEHRVLDAGCGICGPARYFAKKYWMYNRCRNHL